MNMDRTRKMLIIEIMIFQQKQKDLTTFKHNLQFIVQLSLKDLPLLVVNEISTGIFLKAIIEKWHCYLQCTGGCHIKKHLVVMNVALGSHSLQFAAFCTSV